MGSISLKLKVTAIAVPFLCAVAATFLSRTATIGPSYVRPDWTNQRARLTASVCGLKRMTSLRDVMLHNVDMCGVGRTSQRIKHEKPRGSHSYRGSASHYATPSNGVGFVWIAFLMPCGGSW